MRSEHSSEIFMSTAACGLSVSAGKSGHEAGHAAASWSASLLLRRCLCLGRPRERGRSQGTRLQVTLNAICGRRWPGERLLSRG